MLDHIVIGTANFCKGYGILANGDVVPKDVVESIVKCALKYNIDFFDTAFSYGDFLGLLDGKAYLPDLNIITKISVLDSCEGLYAKLKDLLIAGKLTRIYGLLIHDPKNLNKSDLFALRDLFDKLREDGLVFKIGVSIYDMNELEQFEKICVPNLVQIPLNPLNQTFNNNEFRKYVSSHNIEVHARSLFLQGILLANELPKSLNALEPLWTEFCKIVQPFASRLKVLLAWAKQQDFIDKWVLGVSSIDDLNEIIKSSQSLNNYTAENLFENFKQRSHPMVDPRNWNIL